MEKLDTRRLFFCGDIHGELSTLVWEITNKYEITNADVIILGDFGVGFDNGMDNLYTENAKKLEKADVTIWSIRGNHDDPKYFEDSKYSYPRLKFIKDYEILNLDGYTILPIGGAHSVDITYRLEENAKLERKGSEKRVWWEGESVKKIELSKLPTKVDIIISHTAPLTFDPIATRWSECPEGQYERILEERRYLDQVLNNVTTSYWYYGHYHESYSGYYSNVSWRCLNINELFEAKEKIERNPQGEIKDKDKEV